MDTTTFDPVTAMPEPGRAAYVADTVLAQHPILGRVIIVHVAGHAHSQFDQVAHRHAAATARAMRWPGVRLAEHTLRQDKRLATFVYGYVPEEALLRVPPVLYPTGAEAPEGALSEVYDGVYAVKILDFGELPYMAHCWDCGEVFGPEHGRITAVKTLGIDADEDYLHENCWKIRKNNWGRPPRLPEGPLAWHTANQAPSPQARCPPPSTAS